MTSEISFDLFLLLPGYKWHPHSGYRLISTRGAVPHYATRSLSFSLSMCTPAWSIKPLVSSGLFWDELCAPVGVWILLYDSHPMDVDDILHPSRDGSVLGWCVLHLYFASCTGTEQHILSKFSSTPRKLSSSLFPAHLFFSLSVHQPALIAP